MYYKEDWQKTKERFEALWRNEIIDRCCISVMSPKRDGKFDSNFAKKNDLYQLDNRTCALNQKNPEAAWKKISKNMENLFYGGESVPQIWLNYGAAGHAAYFGCKHVVAENTTWLEHYADSIDDSRIKFNPNSEVLIDKINAAKYFAEHVKGKCMISTPDNSGSLDALAAIRGTTELMYDLVDYEDEVINLVDKITDSWVDINNVLFDICKDVNEYGATIGWLSIWAPGKFAQMQSDISVMLSNPQFKTFYMPELRKSVDNLDYALYHFDGAEQIRHLDDLLATDKVGMIQWVSVVGQPKYFHYIDTLKKIQAAGKGLLINDVDINDVEKILEVLSPNGLLLMTQANSEDEANSLLKMAEKWSIKNKLY